MERLKRLAGAASSSSLSLSTRAVCTRFGSCPALHSRPSFSLFGPSEKSKRPCAPAAVCRLISPFYATPTRRTEHLEPQQSLQSDINPPSLPSLGGWGCKCDNQWLCVPLESKLASVDPDVAAATFADKEYLAVAEAMMWRKTDQGRRREPWRFFLTSHASCGRQFHSVWIWVMSQWTFTEESAW